MASTSTINISKNALKSNIEFIKKIISQNVKISAVIKGNAYGHGTDKILPALEDIGIRHFSVYSSAEAKIAFKYKTNNNSVIMIMGYISNSDYKWIIENNIQFYIYELTVLEKAIELAKESKSKALIHLDIETGMNRTGLNINDLNRAIKLIKENTNFINVIGFTSHLAGAESIANHIRVTKQLSVFKKRIKFLEENNITAEVKHIACSAAAINYPSSCFDLIRTGILIYGYWPTKETFLNYLHKNKTREDELKRVIKWHSKVMSVKNVKEGEFIGYGLGYQATRDLKIMIVPVGYANGYSRSLSNNGHVLVSSCRAPVIGAVNMNMVICDITEIDNVKIGDEVVLIGKQGDHEISFASFAEMNNSLNYEILARLPGNIPRILTNN